VRCLLTAFAFALSALLGTSAIRGAETSANHDFDDWKASPHGRAGVSCERCHRAGGLRQDLPSTDPKSPVYFTTVPQTCGACHAAEFAAFRKSAHFRELERSGRGPNCVTCHGAMASRVLTPHDLQITCALCHRSPAPAQAALRALLSSRASLRALESALARAKTTGAGTARQESSRAESRRLYQRASDTWHTFRVADVARDAEESERISREASNELRMKRNIP